ncbi:MAG: hypothetical protein JNJ63_11455 [Hyphomonadaceae bacterium]|nr:hypothetical protein [Hyphomonadaceae bacterium]
MRGPVAAGEQSALRRVAIVLAALAGAALALWIGFIALLALVLSLTSDAHIIANLQQASERGTLSHQSYPMSFFGHNDHRFDMYSDCVALGINLGNESDGVLHRIAASPTATHEDGSGPCVEFNAALRSGAVVADQGYLRFWHGYQAYFRVLLSLAPFDVMMRITAMLFFASLVFFAIEIERLFGAWAWAIALVPFFALSDFLTAPMVATHALSLAWAFASASLTPLIIRRVREPERLALPLFAFAAGATYNFLNFLVNPPLAPALIAFFYIAAQDRSTPNKAWRAALYGGLLAALFFAGFFTAWVEKWLTAAAVLGPDALQAELTRIFGKYDATRVRLEVNFLGATRRNLIPAWNPWFFAYILAAGAVACAMLAVLIRKSGSLAERVTAFAAMCSPLVFVVGWVELARAHSAEHSGFVSRSFLLFGIFPLLAVLKLWREGRLTLRRA